MRPIVRSLAVVAAAGCVASHPGPPAPTAIDPDEYAIYRGVLDGQPAAAPLFVLAATDTAAGSEMVAGLTEDRELRAAFASAVAMRGRISPAGLRSSHAAVVSETGLPSWPMPLEAQEQRWAQLQARYGRHAAFVRLSRVGFNRDRTRAIVMYTARTGPGCFVGWHAALYERARGDWHQVRGVAAFC